MYKPSLEFFKIQREINLLIRSLCPLTEEKLEKLDLKNEPIDWNNLCCIDAKEMVVAYIEGISSKAYKFKKWLKEELKKKGYNNIEIVAEQQND